ncbi:MAG: InlB B-repeat-containing protein, partial [Treponema sp.]|nr:InlB B-repeat-containing protein [Treponema sp.]
MRNLFRFYGIFVFIGLLFLTVSCAGGGSGDGGISYDDDDSATSSSSSAAVFTVTYYSDADGVSAPSVTKASVGGSVTITTTKPVREGYVFIGWATSSGGTVKYQPGSKVVLKVSISLYAVWKEGTPATYTVRHVMPDGTAADTQSGLTGVSGGNTNATANEYPGYHPSGVPNTSIADDGSTVVNISYAANTYTIAFNTNGGTGGSTASAPATYGSSISLTPNGFTKTGYSFAGWNTKSDGTGTAYSDKASVSNLTSENGVTITLYAMWKPNTYTVKFDANGGTGSMSNMGATYDKAMNLPANAFKRKGFAFSGWGSSADASSPAHSNSESVKNLTADNGVTITLYALWTEGAYSITFNANGGSGTMADQTASSASPTSLSSNGFTRTGYTFAGWATTQSAATAAYSNGQSVSALTDDDAVTLYAVWKPNTYTIKFDANGGTGSMGNQIATYDKAASLSANKFSRDGYKFMGWSKTSSATGSDYAGGASVKNLTADNGVTITLYAVWASNTYTISFSANGGTGSMSGQGASLDGSTSLNPNSFSRTGYTFAGWATSASATSPKYTDASSIPALTSELGASVTLYAVWKPITYTIKFDANGGTGSMSDQSATYDKAAALSANKFSRSGYKFAGWSTNKNASDSKYAG